MPPFPRSMSDIWQAYHRLRRRKAASDMGAPKPIEWPDIDAFVRQSGARLTPWQIEVIEDLDDIYLQPTSKPALPEGQIVNAAASVADTAGVRDILSAVGKRRVVKRKKGGSQ